MCVPERMGGLGFKDLHLFNQSQVTKQAWQLVNNPMFISSQILKGKYFLASSFLRAKNKEGSSYLWKSYLRGRELVVKGLRWRVGNGVRINGFEDPWLHCISIRW